MTTTLSKARADQLIADEFGVNADYVSELLSQFERDPSSVDDEWRSVFDELLSSGRVVTETQLEPPAEFYSQDGSQDGAAPGVIHATYDWGAGEDKGDDATRRRGDGATQTAPERAKEASATVPALATPQQAKLIAVDTVERIPIRGPALRIAENMEQASRFRLLLRNGRFR